MLKLIILAFLLLVYAKAEGTSNEKVETPKPTCAHKSIEDEAISTIRKSLWPNLEKEFKQMKEELQNPAICSNENSLKKLIKFELLLNFLKDVQLNDCCAKNVNFGELLKDLNGKVQKIEDKQMEQITRTENIIKEIPTTIEPDMSIVENKIDERIQQTENYLNEKFVIEKNLLKNISTSVMELNTHKACAQQPVPNNFQKIGNKYFYFEKYNRLSWFGAWDACRRMDAYLAVIDNAQEMNAITGKLKYDHYWLGATDLDSEGTFRIMRTGMPIQYTRWNYGQPNNENGNEHCLEFMGCSYNMNDRNCKSRQLFVCQK